jgi:hypothetical protein
VGLERCPLSLVSTIEELLGRKSSDYGLESREYAVMTATLTKLQPLSAKVGTNFANKGGLSVGIVHSGTQESYFFFFLFFFFCVW